MSRSLNDSQRNRISAAARDASSRSAESRRCPSCDRKSALKYISDEEGFGSTCRWCAWSSYATREEWNQRTGKPGLF